MKLVYLKRLAKQILKDIRVKSLDFDPKSDFEVKLTQENKRNFDGNEVGGKVFWLKLDFSNIKDISLVEIDPLMKEYST